MQTDRIQAALNKINNASKRLDRLEASSNATFVVDTIVAFGWLALICGGMVWFFCG